MNNIKIIGLGILLSVLLGFLVPAFSSSVPSIAITDLASDSGKQESILEQSRISVDQAPHIVKKIYNKNELIGVLNDTGKLDKEFKNVYKQKYEKEFPNTSLGLGEDVYITQEQSYYEYENIDDEIIQYLDKNNLFSIVTNRIEISNGAVIYVKNIDDFTNAREQYLLNFVDPKVYDLLKNNQKPAPLTDYGEQDIDINVSESVSVSTGLASIDKIYTSEEQIMEFLSYSYGVEKQYYTVQKYQTVQGVASRASTGITPQQLITINPGVLFSEDQVLSEGMKLNVTYFDSPLTVKVTKERLVEEKIYPEKTKIISDDSLNYGERVVVTKEVVGKKNVRYYDTYTNGVLSSGEEISSVVTLQPVQEVVRVGTAGMDGGEYEEYTGSSLGTGSFRFPVNHPKIICGWGCYAGHQAIDVQDRYNVWGNAYAADNGVVYQNSYNSISGNFIIINHGNNFYTYYGHLRYRSGLKKGSKVYKGQFIGKVGMTGFATAPHVHFEIWVGKPYGGGGHRVQPCRYLGC